MSCNNNYTNTHCTSANYVPENPCLTTSYPLKGYCCTDPDFGNANCKCSGASGPDEWRAVTDDICASGKGKFYFSAICQRNSYTADPTDCCFQDFAYNNCSPANKNNACYSYKNYQDNPNLLDGINTCSPDTLNITCENRSSGKSCKDRVFGYCTGSDLDKNDTSWFYRWMDPLTGQPVQRLYSSSNTSVDPKIGGCMYSLQRNLFTPNGGTDCTKQDSNCIVPPYSITSKCGQPGAGLPVVSSGQKYVQDMINAMFVKYYQQGFVLGAQPGTKGYNPFEDFLRKYICCAYPELCQQALNGICGTIPSSRLSLNPSLANWCGCHLNNSEYQRYVNQFQISKECTPLCNRSDVIPLTDGLGNKIKCQQDICLIDDLAINLINSQASGLNISQICGSCGDGQQCTCILSNNSIDVVDTALNGNITVSQMCSNGPTCTIPNTTGIGPPMLSVPCGSSSDPFVEYTNQISIVQRQEKLAWWLIIGIVLLIGIIILFVVIYFRGRSRK